MGANPSGNVAGNGRARRVSLTIAAVTLFLGLIWILFSTYAAPALIASAYRGESLPFLNRIISGQASHPLAAYLSAWRTLSWRLLLALGMAGLFGILAIQPRVRAALKGSTIPGGDFSRVLPLAWGRVLAIHALIALIAGGSLYNIAMDQQHWPFSNYPMFSSGVKSWTLNIPILYGVTGEHPLHEFPLFQSQYTQPFDNTRLQTVLADSLASHQADRTQVLKQSVRDFFRRYNENRLTGRNSGPPLQAMRLYRASWVLDPRGRNVDRPDRKTLIVEIKRAEIGDR